MKNTVRIILSAAFLCAAALPAPAADAAGEKAAAAGKAVARAAETAAASKGVMTLSWELYQIKEFRNRAPGQTGKKLRIPWNKREVTTSCNVTLQDGRVILPSDCLAAPQRDKDERVRLTKATVRAFNGAVWTFHPAQVSLPLPK